MKTGRFTFLFYQIISLCFGVGGGFLYGLLFKNISARFLPSASTNTTSSGAQQTLLFVLFSLARLIFLAAFWILILRNQELNSILVAVSFIVTFLIATIVRGSNGRYQFFRSR